MKYSNGIPDIDKDQFEILLLIYAAHVDYMFTEDEQNFILKMCDQEAFESTYRLFLSMDEFTCLKTIIKFKEIYYADDESQERLFMVLKKLFSIDGDFSRMEKVFVAFFKRLKQL